MIKRLRYARLSRFQLALMTVLSALATALVISAATGRTAAQSAALAALNSSRVVVQQGQSAAPTTGGTSSGPSLPAPSPTVPVAAAPASAPARQPATSTAAAPATPAAYTPSAPPANPISRPTLKPSKIKHVFVIALSAPSFDDAFGPSSDAHYLNHVLKPKGTLLSHYQTLGSAELPDYLAMIGGQAPNTNTNGECSIYAEFPASAKPASSGQVPGAGCVYPNTVLTIGDQVTAAGHAWNAYIEGMGSACLHPNSGAADDVPLLGAGADYDTRHNPFVYFHSLLDLGDCASDDLDLSKLDGALGAPSRTPTYSFIAPGACEDASQSTCADGTPGGLVAEDSFLESWVPRILRSRAYRKDGALVIAFAHASPAGSATSAPAGPVRIGALVLSRFARPGHSLNAVYNPYSILRSTEDLLGQKPLVHAKHATSFVKQALPGA